MRIEQHSPEVPPAHERQVLVRDKILNRTIIPDVNNLEQTNKKLYDFLYHFEEHGWAVYEAMYPVKMIQNLLEEANKMLKNNYSGFDMNKQSTYANFPFELIGFMDFYHFKSLYDMRFYPPMIELFKQLYNVDQLRSIFHCMSFKRSIYEVTGKGTVVHEDWGHDGFLHNDANLITGEAPVPIQCAVALSETTPDMVWSCY
jgi:hypothetical protein